MEMLPYLGYAVAFISLIYAMTSKKRLENLNALLSEAAERYQTARSDAQAAEVKLQKSRKDTADISARLTQLEKQKATKEQQLSTLQKDHDKALEEVNEKLARLTDHSQAQQKALAEQLSEAIRDKHQALEQLNKLSSQKTNLSPKELKELESKLSQLSEEYKRIKSELNKAQHLIGKQNEVLKVANPKIVRKIQAKVSKLETLYASMKGLKDMSEERNQNWETALRYMAAHITQKDVDLTAPMGAVVGPALEMLGKQLVVDDEHNGQNESTDHEDIMSAPEQSAKDVTPAETI